MASTKRVKVGIIGSQFEAEIHAESFHIVFPQEMHHFARCVRGKETPQATGEDGRLVQEVLYAAYHSAGTGQKVMLPFRPAGVLRPIDLWRKPASA